MSVNLIVYKSNGHKPHIMTVKVYFDLETYRPKKDHAFVEEKIIGTGLLIDLDGSAEDTIQTYNYGDPLPTSGVWEYMDIVTKEDQEKEGEKKLLSRFFDVMERLKKDYGVVILIGFNILRFDIPLILQRASEFKVRELKDMNKFIHDFFVMDYFQIFLPFNDMKFKGNSLENAVNIISNVSKKEPPRRVGRGADIPSLYDSEKYEEIKEHLKSDLLLLRYIDRNFHLLTRVLPRKMSELQ